MNEFLENLKQEAEANPTVTLGVIAGLLGAAASVVKAYGQATGSRAFARDVNRRARLAKKQR